MPKVLVADKIAEQGVELLRASGIDVEVKTGLGEEDLKKAVAPCEGLIVRSATKVTEAVIRAGKDLKVIGRAGVGYDNIDVQAATRAGVIVMNTPLGNIASAAEHAVGLLFSLSRHVPAADASMHEGKWEKKKFTGVELRQKTLGIVGLGKVGQIVARVARAIPMKVIANDPFIPAERARELGVEMTDLDELLESSDFVSVHAPLNEHTRGMIGEKELRRMKPTAMLVNCARGGIVVEEALVRALKEGWIAGAAVDVFEKEPLGESELRGLPNIVLTPHLGAATREAQEKVAEDVARQFVEFFESGRILNAVNVSAVLPPELAAFAELAENLGALAAQLVSAPVRKLNVGFHGKVASVENLRAVSLSALKGVLRRSGESAVNLVNVESVAETRGLELVEHKSTQARNYTSLLTVRIATKEGERIVAGTTFDEREPRIVLVDDYDIDLRPAPNLLIMFYPDLPGMIGRIGTILGEAGINIAGMAVGRREKSGRAVVVLTVDDPAPEEVLERIGESIGSDEIHSVRLGP